jgi:tight adherence protein B
MSAASTELAAALLIGGGAALMVVGWLVRTQRKEQRLADVLDLPWGERDVPAEALAATPSMSPLTRRLGSALSLFDRRGTFAATVERAHLPVRPGEFMALVVVAAVVGGLLLAELTAAPLIGLMTAVAIVLVARRWPSLMAARRSKALAAQLPGAFSLVASSIASGHTFLRSIEMLRAECNAPLSEELDRVVAETMLGEELTDALAHMADRFDITDLHWAVHAVRTQQLTGGRIADVLHTLAEFMRTREEVRREVLVLSAEGRISAYVLMALPILLGLAIQIMDPSYLKPFFSGLGLLALGGCAAMLAVGFSIILRMVDIKV